MSHRGNPRSPALPQGLIWIKPRVPVILTTEQERDVSMGEAYREIAQGLTNRNIPTPRGGDLWNAMTVMR